MFERYTEKARRTIFFGRYEASQFGSPNIESEHLLLGLLREDKRLANQFLRSHASVESIRGQIEAHTTLRQSVPTSVDLPFSNECKRILAYAAEEAFRFEHKHIGTEHILLGTLREKDCFAARLLRERGVELELVRKEIPSASEQNTMPGEAVEQTRNSIFAQFSAGPAEALRRLKTGIGLVRVSPTEFVLTYHNSSLIPRIGEKISIADKGSGSAVYRVVDIEWSFEQISGVAQLNVVKLTVSKEAADEGGSWQAYT
jgi:hypothetical protein